MVRERNLKATFFLSVKKCWGVFSSNVIKKYYHLIPSRLQLFSTIEVYWGSVYPPSISLSGNLISRYELKICTRVTPCEMTFGDVTHWVTWLVCKLHTKNWLLMSSSKIDIDVIIRLLWPRSHNLESFRDLHVSNLRD